jgi:hypothetical protein
MTTEDYIKSLRQKIAILKDGRLVAIAAQDTHVKMIERIFDEHQNANDGKIGEYNSTDPIYVNPDNSPKKFPRKGKPDAKGKSKSKFANGEDHKTGWFSSYKSYREKIGRQVGEVDLKLFGRLQSDFSKGVVKKDELTYTSGVNEDNAGKIKGIESKYGSVFRLTPKERTNFKQVLAFESFKLLQ